MKNNVELVFEELKNLPFPESPESDDLADVIAELAELDGHLAGLAVSVMKGSSSDLTRLPDLANIAQCLDEINIESEDDQKIMEATRKYVHALAKLRNALRSYDVQK